MDGELRVPPVPAQQFTLTLTSLELLHLEAALDLFKTLEEDLKPEDIGAPKMWLGGFEDHYDEAAIKEMHKTVYNLRDEINDLEMHP